ncbi:hypothetical protein ACP4OV_022650 [Aristida adscensionis]
MCRATTLDDGHAAAAGGGSSLEIRAFYLRLAAAQAGEELRLVYLPPIGGAALGLNGRALPPAAPAEVRLRAVAAGGGGGGAAYASADRVRAAEGARFEVYAGKERAADGVFGRRPGGGGWRVECRRHASTPSTAAVVTEVAVLAAGGALITGRARASRRGMAGCGATRLEGIPEEATDVGWGCECGACGEDWEVVAGADDDDDDVDGEEDWKGDEEEVEMETVRWAMEMGVWAVCLGVGLLATARRFRRKRAFW